MTVAACALAPTPTPVLTLESDRGMTTSDRALFDFTGFLAGGALDDVFRTHTPKSGPGKWEVTRLSGGLINVTVRVVRREDRKSCEKNSRRSVVIKYAPPFVAGIGEGMPLGTFRQVSTSPHFLESSLHQGCTHIVVGFTYTYR